MDSLYRCCAGLDVHKKTVMACVRRLEPSGEVATEIRQFGTMTRELLDLRDWLSEGGVSHVALESTGVFWKPVYNLLEEDFEVLLCNAQHLKNVPGRKTDVKDSEWIAQLLQVGLLKASFVPAKPQRELRDLTRHRAQCAHEKTRIANRIHKTLQEANIKLSSVASDILGKSGRAMIRGLIAGQEEAEKLADLARNSLRRKIPELKQALHGRVTDHHRFMLQTLFEQLTNVEQTIEKLDDRIESLLSQEGEEDCEDLPGAKAVSLLVTVPGISQRGAETILAEIGGDMSQFPTASHLCSWSGLSPGNNESAGKRKSGKTTKGNRWLRRILVQAALSASRSKKSYLASKFRRISGRRGGKRAAVAVANTILRVIYHLLSKGEEYRDLGAAYLEGWEPKGLARSFARRLETPGTT